MSIQVLYNADILIDGTAASTEMNKVKLTTNQVTKEKTVFGDVARNFNPGIYEVTADGSYFYQTGAPKGQNLTVNALESKFGSGALPTFTAQVVTVAPDKTEGNLASFFKGVVATVDHDWTHGEMPKGTFKYNGAGDGTAVLGTRLLRSAQTSGTSGLGTAYNLGAVSSSQSIYAALNVISATTTASGGAFTIISSATSSLTSPSTRITFTVGTSSFSGEWQSAAGAITDTWWAAKWLTFSGTGFTASISAGIR